MADDYNKFQLWVEAEKIAMHFNSLLIQLRLRALAGISVIAGLAGIFSGGSDGGLNWMLMAFILFVLLFVWLSIYVIDRLYYQNLLSGAVDAIINLEKSTAGDPIPINISTFIKQKATNDNKNSSSMWAVNVFYSIIAFLLFFLFAFSLYKAGFKPPCLR